MVGHGAMDSVVVRRPEEVREIVAVWERRKSGCMAQNQAGATSIENFFLTFCVLYSAKNLIVVRLW